MREKMSVYKITLMQDMQGAYAWTHFDLQAYGKIVMMR